jgi:predicted MPP superfamily phosphohydrolase
MLSARTSAPPARIPRRVQSRRRRPLSRGGSVFGRILAFLAACWFVVGALVSPVIPGGWLAMAAAMLVMTGLPLAAFIRRQRRREYPGALVRLLVYRPFWYAQLFVLFAGLAGIAGVVVGAPFGASGLVGRWMVGAAAVAYAIGILAGWIGSRLLHVRQLTATFPNFPAELEGLRIVQLSDLHIGPQTSRRFLDRVRSYVTASGADVIAVTGDLVDDHAPDSAHYAAALGNIAAPLGVYVVPGNHDVYANWLAVRAELDRLPLTILVNESRIVRREDGHFAIAGTGDPAGRWIATSRAAPDIDATLRDIPPGTFTIALAHNPSLWPALAERGVQLTLSGHTHWGQLALPSLKWSLAGVFLDHAMGVLGRGGSLLYIHPGTGFWGIPFRIGARPEVTIIELRRGARVALGPLNEVSALS